ncbi:MAG: hypothetical protein QM765_40590 [Myxococcales bacterium]
MLELDSPRWATFAPEGAGPRLVPNLIQKLERVPSDDDWDEIWELIASQWSLSLSAYAAVPHLVRLLEEQERLARPDSLLGLARCACPLESEGKCPDDLQDEFDAALAKAAAIATRLAKDKSQAPEGYLGLLCAAAALSGRSKLGRLALSAAYCSEAEIPVCCPTCHEHLIVLFDEGFAQASVRLEGPEQLAAVAPVAPAEADKARGSDAVWGLGMAQQAGQQEAAAWLCALAGFGECPQCHSPFVPLDHLSYGS